MTALEELVQAGGDIHRYFTAAEITSAKDFVAPLIVRAWVSSALEVLKFVLVLGLGWNRWLLGWCTRGAGWLRDRVISAPLRRLGLAMDRVWRGQGWGAAAFFVLSFSYLSTLVNLPQSLYFDWYRDREAGLTSQSLPSMLGDLLKNMAAASVGLLCLGFGVYALMRWLPRLWWLVLGCVCIAAMLISGYFDSSRSNLLFEKHPLEAGPQRTAVEQVLREGHVEFKDVMVINMSRQTNTANAYFDGQGPTREIVIFDTMLAQYTPAEIAAAIAHEMGHLHEGVLSRKVIAALLMPPLLYLFHLILIWGARTRRLGFDSETDIAGLPLLYLLWFVMTFASTPFQFGAQQARERDADAASLATTRDPEAFTSLMVKLGKQNKVDPIPDEWVERWMSDHPALARRLAMALRYQREHPGVLPLIASSTPASPPPGSAIRAGAD